MILKYLIIIIQWSSSHVKMTDVDRKTIDVDRKKIDVDPNFVQLLARFCLMLLNFFGWIRLALAVDKMPEASLFGINSKMTMGSWLLLITGCQFHIPFYSSRMLPNTFALCIVLQSYAFWIENKVQVALSLLTIGTVIFRCDLMLLLGSLGLMWLFQRQISITSALKVGIATMFFALILTLPLDSLLWERPVWPEGEVFYFNAILGKSKEWGSSPWHWYFTSALPKAMLLTILLVPLSTFRIVEAIVAIEQRLRRPKSVNYNELPKSGYVWVDSQWLQFIFPVFGFVGLYSFLAHKEIRFM